MKASVGRLPAKLEVYVLRWLWRNIKSLFPSRKFDPWRYGSDKHTSPWDDHANQSKLREIIESGEIKQGGLPRAPEVD